MGRSARILQPSQPDAPCSVKLRLLATTDLHGHLLPWDYYHDAPLEGFGLARLATLIHAARSEVANCLYFDNGDLIEGSPLAEYALYAAGIGGLTTHPMIAALNSLGCDAAALGNHEFSYGLPFLRSVMRGAAYPVLCANIFTVTGKGAAAIETPLMQPWVILQRDVVDEAGNSHPLQVGVVGLTPPQVLEWDKAALADHPELLARDMVAAATQAVAAVRAAGADIVVALAHTGIGQANYAAGSENVGLRLAGLPGVDALILGHEHQVFPAPGQAGVLGRTPAVMPGAFGTHLGVMDLTLSRKGRKWAVAGAQVACRPIAARGAWGEAVSLVATDATIAANADFCHKATRKWMMRPIGATKVPLHSYFSVVQPTATQALIAEAQAAYLAEMVVGTQWEGLPILSAAAPFKSGGRGGPDHFTNVPEGPLLLRHAADLYVHPNRFAAIVVTGAELRGWLERAATAYAQVRPMLQDQALLDDRFPATCLEMVSGVSYQIDLAAPPAYDAPNGRAATSAQGAQGAQGAHGSPGRIRNLQFAGKPVTDDMRFALATNSHRLGVLQAGLAGAEVIIAGPGALGSRDVLLRHLARHHATPAPAPLQWSFMPVKGATVTIDTAPAAVAHTSDIAAFAPENLGLTAAGFLRFRLHL